MNKYALRRFSFLIRAISIPLLVLGLYGISGLAWGDAGTTTQPGVAPGLCKTNWLYQGQIGLSTNFFPMKTDGIDNVVNKFQVKTVAEQAADAGAAWFLLTLHHESWIMMAPNATYDRIMGSGAFTPARDVPLELYEQLHAKNIKLMLYVNIKLSPNAAPGVAEAMGGWPPSERVIENIAAVYREYSLRYGDKVAGWWVDGAQNPAYKTSPNRERWFKTIADALHAGNPQALVTFNPGLVALAPALRIDRYTKSAEYTAGESEDIDPLPSGRWVNGAQWHLWTYLGEWWGSGGTRYSDQALRDYVFFVTSRGGAVTFDVGTLGVNRGRAIPGQALNAVKTPYFGYIDPAQIKQVKAMRQSRHAATDALSSCVN